MQRRSPTLQGKESTDATRPVAKPMQHQKIRIQLCKSLILMRKFLIKKVATLISSVFMRVSSPSSQGSSQSYPQKTRTIRSAIIKTEFRHRKIDFVKHHTSRRMAHLAPPCLFCFCARHHFGASLCFKGQQSIARHSFNSGNGKHTTGISK